jgi:hypothetical protein
MNQLSKNRIRGDPWLEVSQNDNIHPHNFAAVCIATSTGTACLTDWLNYLATFADFLTLQAQEHMSTFFYKEQQKMSSLFREQEQTRDESRSYSHPDSDGVGSIPATSAPSTMHET